MHQTVFHSRLQSRAIFFAEISGVQALKSQGRGAKMVKADFKGQLPNKETIKKMIEKLYISQTGKFANCATYIIFPRNFAQRIFIFARRRDILRIQFFPFHCFFHCYFSPFFLAFPCGLLCNIILCAAKMCICVADSYIFWNS